MFDLLVEEGAELDDRNRLGDNVCHSLIRLRFLTVITCNYTIRNLDVEFHKLRAVP